MKTLCVDYEALISDEVFLEGAIASDVGGLRRRLARCQAVRDVSRKLASDPVRIRALCEFVQELLEQPYDKGYRHPHDMGICAALVLLEQSPLGYVRRLFAQLGTTRLPSLVWVQRMAEYCAGRFVTTDRVEWSVPQHLAAGRSVALAAANATSQISGLNNGAMSVAYESTAV